MKKMLFILSIVIIASTFTYSQEEEQSQQTIKKNMLYLEGGILATNLGFGNGMIINGGYEGFILDWLSDYADLNIWMMPDTLVCANFGVLFHPVPRFTIDPFIGISLAYGIWLSSKIRVIDIPLVAGANLMVNDFFGFRLMGKLYLASLKDVILVEIDAGFVLKF